MSLSSAVLASVPLLGGWAVHVSYLWCQLWRTRRDPVTGLVTRAGFTRRVSRRVSRARGAVIVADVDGFKPVNDTYGHAAGDQVLAALAARLRRLAPGGLAARLGGDEFALFVPDFPAHPIRRADWLDDVTAAVTAPCALGGDVVIRPGISIGAATMDRVPVWSRSLSSALEAADRAMYAAKTSGGGWCVYSPADHGHVAEESAPTRRVRHHGISVPRTA